MPSPPPPRAVCHLSRRDHNGFAALEFVAPSFLESEFCLFSGSGKSGVYLGAETCLSSGLSSQTTDKTSGMYKAQVHRVLHCYSIA